MAQPGPPSNNGIPLPTLLLLLLLAVPVGFLSSLAAVSLAGLDVPLPDFIVSNILDPLLTPLAPLLGRIEPDIFKLEGTEHTLNTQGCRVDPRMDACEDAEIHYPSSTAFLACSSVKARAAWFPPLVRRDPPPRNESDPVFAYNLKAWTNKGALTQLNLKYPEGDLTNHELRTHGIGIWYASKPKGGTGKDETVRLFLVNHKTTGSCITVFDHQLGSSEAVWVRDVCHKAIYTPNDVAPLSSNSFYTTNDHTFLLRPLRTLEDRYGPFPGSTVSHCTFDDSPNGQVTCEYAVKKMVAANGVLVSPDGRTVWVCSSRGGKINVYDVDEGGQLKLKEVVNVGSAVDNLSHDPRTRTTYFALFPSRTKLYAHFHSPLHSSLRAPSAIGKLIPGGYELVYRDEGGLLSDGTMGVVDSETGQSIIGGVMTAGTVICPRAL